MDERIGVFLCQCGTPDAAAEHITTLRDAAAGIPSVAGVFTGQRWCSDEGRAALKTIVQEQTISRVVVAGCLPLPHEAAFRQTLTAAGLNPFLLAVGPLPARSVTADGDPGDSAFLAAAVAQVRALVRRVALQNILDTIEIESSGDFLVIGAGIAGLTAARQLALHGRTVVLVEQEAWLGGTLAACATLFPGRERAGDILQQPSQAVLVDPYITPLLLSRVTAVTGGPGNFQATVSTAARGVVIDRCTGCGACIAACPVVSADPAAGGAERHAIYTARAGAVPNVPLIDQRRCLRFAGQECRACADACAAAAIDFDQKETTRTVVAGGVVMATGCSLTETAGMQHLLPGDPAVLTSLSFERLLSENGTLRLPGGTAPQAIAFIHCVGSRSSAYHPYCSGICCTESVKLAHAAKQAVAGAALHLYGLYADWCLPGKGQQEFANRVAADGVEYIRVPDPNQISINRQDGRLVIAYGNGSITVDMVVLLPALVPAQGMPALAAQFSVPLDAHGFVTAGSELLSPTATTVNGIYAAGCAAGPKDAPHSITQAQAAAAIAVQAVIAGVKQLLPPALAAVNAERCSGCGICAGLCPHNALTFDPSSRLARITRTCQGCGICVAACPSAAIIHYLCSDDQAAAEIQEVIHD
jgi:heterodisulfide reductase subunit A